MPNPAQSDLLMSFIGKDGSSIETILENKLFDLGTKILYLERAISQDSRSFNQSLNKLETDIGFVRGLKLINDLCFNNEIRGYDNVKKLALDYCFAALGPVDPNDFEKTIKEIITTIIKDLSLGHEKEIELQKQARIAKEAITIAQHHELNLANLAKKASLILASTYGNVSEVENILSSEGRVIRTGAEDKAFEMATKHENFEVLEKIWELLATIRNPGISNRAKGESFIWAVQHGSPAFLRRFAEHDLFNECNDLAFIYAAQAGNIDLLERIYLSAPNISYRSIKDAFIESYYAPSGHSVARRIVELTINTIPNSDKVLLALLAISYNVFTDREIFDLVGPELPPELEELRPKRRCSIM